jgi:hypothetical protein
LRLAVLIELTGLLSALLLLITVKLTGLLALLLIAIDVACLGWVLVAFVIHCVPHDIFEPTAHAQEERQKEG